MNYSIEVTEEPDALDLVDELKDHLNLNNGTSEDTQLAMFLNSAMFLFEFETDGRVVLPTTFKQHYPTWGAGGLELARTKVLSITSVKYYDENEVQQTLSTDDWDADLTGVPAIIYVPDGDYPSLSSTKPRPITVEYVCGWVDQDHLPDDVLIAIFELAGHMYAHRESHTDETLTEVPMGFRRLCVKYKTGLGGL